MRFLSQEVIDPENARGIAQYDVAFFGSDDPDERGSRSIALTRSLGRSSAHVTYDPLTFQLVVEGRGYRDDELMDLPQHYPGDRILVDTTSLEFPAIALLLMAYRDFAPRKPRFGFIYIEPARYVPKARRDGDCCAVAFDLNAGFKANTPIPQFAPYLSSDKKAHLVAFLGFEGARILRVLQADDGHFYKEVTVVFAVPPFQAAWNTHSLMANTRLLEYSNANVRYSGANDPLSAYTLLREVQQALGGSGCSRLAVAPFGTKPAALGTALYCVEQKLMRVVYDHPVAKAGRTEGINRTHWYEVDWD